MSEQLSDNMRVAGRKSARTLARMRRFEVFETIPDPFAVVAPVRDPDGHITDFECGFAKTTMGEEIRVDSRALVGCRLFDVRPAHRSSGLFKMYCHTLCTWASLLLDVGTSRQGIVGHEIERAPRLPHGCRGFSPISTPRCRALEASERLLEVNSPRGSRT